MINKYFCVACLLGILVVSCGGPSGEPSPHLKSDAELASEKAGARAAVEAVNDSITSLSREGRFEDAGRFFMPDVVQMISGQPPVRGREAWIATQRDMAAIGSWDLELEILDFEFMGNRAVERGRGIQTFEANDNSPIPSMEMAGDYMVLWVKTPQGWRIQWDYVVVEPPAATPLPE